MPYKNKEQAQVNKKKYYQKHKELLIARATQWNMKNKEARKVISKRDNDKRKLAKRVWHEERKFDSNATLLANATCFVCHVKDALVIHHKDGNNGCMGKPTNNAPENLMILCRSHHASMHYRGEIREGVVSYEV